MLPLENLEDLTTTATTTVFPPSDHEHLASAVTEQLSRVVSHEAAVTAATHTTNHEASLSSMQQQLESLNNQTAIEYLIHVRLRLVQYQCCTLQISSQIHTSMLTQKGL